MTNEDEKVVIWPQQCSRLRKETQIKAPGDCLTANKRIFSALYLPYQFANQI